MKQVATLNRIKKRNLLYSAALLALTGLLASCSTAPGPTPPSSEFVLTIETKAEDTQDSVLQQYGGQIISWHPEEGFAILKLSSQDKARLSGEISIQAVENSEVLSPEAEAAGFGGWAGGFGGWAGGFGGWAGGWNTWGGGTTALPVLPAENRFTWNQVRLPQAQAVAKNFGQGVKVAVIDTGIDLAHPMFSGRLAPSTEWKDFLDGDTNPSEVSNGSSYGHGTAAAGIILQVAPKATILPIRVLNPGGKGDIANVVLAIDWAIQKGAKVINISLGTNVDVPALKTQIDYASSQGVYVIASAGNEGNSSKLTYPAQYATTGTNEKYIISVGSINSSNGTSSFCNKGTALELMAPGEAISTSYPGNQVVKATGTSFAAPIVAGAVALGYMDTASSYRGNLESYLTNGGSTNANGHKVISVLNQMRNLPDFTKKQALFVVGNTTLNSGDAAVKTRVEGLGYTVTLKSASSSVTSDATGKDLVLISATVNSSDVNTKFRNVVVPVVVMESDLFDDMMMTSSYGTTGAGSTPTQVSISDTTHPLAAGLSGTVTVYSSGDWMTWGVPSPNAAKVATLTTNSSNSTIFGYNSGGTMVGMNAPARRVGFFARDLGAYNMNTQGQWLLDAAVTWAVSGN